MAFLSGIAGSLGGVGLGAAVVEVAVDTSALSTGLAKAKQEVAASTGAMSASAKAIGTGFIVAGAAAVIGIGKAVSATTSWASQVRSLVRVTGQSTESASALASAAAALGIGVDQLNTGFGLLSKNLVNGTAGFEKYGITVKDATGATLPFDDILTNVIAKFETLPKGPEQAAFAMNVFGRSGKAMIPILAKGTEGIAELEARAKAMGLVLSQDDVDAAKALSIAQNELDEATKGLSVSIGRELLPLVTDLVNFMTEAVVVFEKIPGPIKAGVLVFTALTGALFLLQKAQALVTATWGPLIGAMTAGTAAEGAATAGATQLSLALDAEAASATAAQTATLGWLGALKAVGGLAIGAYALGSVSGAPSDKMEEFANQLKSVQGAFAAGNIANLGGLQSQVDFLTKSFDLNADAVKLAITSNISYADALAQVDPAAAAAADGTDGLTSSTEDLASAADDAAAALRAERDAAHALVPNTVSLADATKTLAQDHRELAKAQENGNIHGARYNALLLKTASDAAAARQAQNALDRSIDQSGKTNEQVAAKIVHLAGGWDALSGSAKRYIDQLVGVKRAADALDGTVANVRVDVIERLVRTGR